MKWWIKLARIHCKNLCTLIPLLTFLFHCCGTCAEESHKKKLQIITNDIIKAGKLSWSQAQKWSRLGVALQGLLRLVDRNGTSNNMNCWQEVWLEFNSLVIHCFLTLSKCQRKIYCTKYFACGKFSEWLFAFASHQLDMPKKRWSHWLDSICVRGKVFISHCRTVLMDNDISDHQNNHQ